MYTKITIKKLSESSEAYTVVDAGKQYVINKKDLHTVTLAVGDSIGVITHPGYPGIVAGLDLGVHRIFHKTREEITDEFLHSKEEALYELLPMLAKCRVEMFAKYVEHFNKTYRFDEVVALTLAFDLSKKFQNAEQIDKFAELPRSEQQKVLPRLQQDLFMSAPMDEVAELAKAFQHDFAKGITGKDLIKLRNSEVLNLPAVVAERRGDFCQPRQKFVNGYILDACSRSLW